MKRLGHFEHCLIKPIDFIPIHPIVFNIAENTKALYSQTQYFNAIQQCATYFCSSKPSSGTFITKV
jgi:hypothetical protein